MAEEFITTRAIAEAIGDALSIPVVSIDAGDASEHFGVVGHFFGQSMTGSSDLTRGLLGWEPTGPTLLEDIASGAYTDEPDAVEE